jgi:hypothetical protein
MPSKDQIIIDIFADFINESSLLKEEDEAKYSSMVVTNPRSSFNISSEKSMRVMSKVDISYIQASGSDKDIAIDTIKTWKRIPALVDILPMSPWPKGFTSKVSSEKTTEILRMILLTSLKSKKISFRRGVSITAKDADAGDSKIFNEEAASYFTIENL